MGILHLLASSNFITYSKVIAKAYGVNAAVLLGAMCSYQSAFGEKEFYKEQSAISDDTCLSVYEIKQATKILKDSGILSVEKKGCPAKNYYRIFDNKLADILLTSELKFNRLEDENLTDCEKPIHNRKNKNLNNNKYNNIYRGDCEEKHEEAGTFSSMIEKEDERLKEPLTEFIKMRKTIKKPLTVYAFKQRLRELHELSHDDATTAVSIINQSITNCWQAFYALKNNAPTGGQNQQKKQSSLELLKEFYDNYEG